MIDFQPTFSDEQMARAKFLTLFSSICENYPKINAIVHLNTISRSKGELAQNPKEGIVYVDSKKWEYRKLLKRTEEYYREMQSNGYNPETDEFDDNEFNYKSKR